MRIPRTIAELDRLVTASDDDAHHAALAERLLAAAESMPPGAGSLRAELLVAAAEQLLLSDQPQRSVAAAEAAVADGGAVRHDARTHLAAALRGAGRAAEARVLLDQVWRSRPTEPGTHLFAGEQSEALGDPLGALRWYTRGLTIAEGKVDSEDDEVSCLVMLIARLGVRHELGMPADDWDHAAADAVAAAHRALQHEPVRVAGVSTDLAAVASQDGDTVVIDLVRV